MGRGLSLLQTEILKVAAKGYVTAMEAWDCTQNWHMSRPSRYATSSRALSRLCHRQMLEKVKTRWGYRSYGRLKSFADVYRLVGFVGPLPLVHKMTPQEFYEQQSERDSGDS